MVPPFRATSVKTLEQVEPLPRSENGIGWGLCIRSDDIKTRSSPFQHNETRLGLTPKKNPGRQCKRGRPGYESSKANALFRDQVAFEQAIYDDEVVKDQKFIALKLSSGNTFTSLAVFCRFACVAV